MAAETVSKATAKEADKMSAAAFDDILRSVGVDPDGIGISEVNKRQLQTSDTSAAVSVPSASDHGLVGNIE